MIFTILNMSDDSNKGDLAILENTILLTRRSFPKARFFVLNVDYGDCEIGNMEKFRHLNRLSIIHYGSFFPKVFTGKSKLLDCFIGIKNLCISLAVLGAVFFLRSHAGFLMPIRLRNPLRSISSADLIILKGGSYIYSYGGLKQLLFLYRMLFTTLISIILKKKVIVLGHSVGPISGLLSMRFASFCLKRINRIVIREKISYEFVTKRLGIKETAVSLLPDIAFWERGEFPYLEREKQVLQVFQSEGINCSKLTGPKLGITVRKWGFPLQKNRQWLFKQYINAIVQVIDAFFLTYEGQIFIMPHAEEDRALGEEIAKRSSHRPFLLKGDYSTEVLRRIYGEMDLFVGTRIHSCIFALTSNTPVIGVAYEIPKGFGIISMVVDESYIIDISKITKKGLLNRTGKILDKKEVTREMISQNVRMLQSEIETKFPQLLNSVLAGIRGTYPC